MHYLGICLEILRRKKETNKQTKEERKKEREEKKYSQC
jgi:hypothetical protein